MDRSPGRPALSSSAVPEAGAAAALLGRLASALRRGAGVGRQGMPAGPVRSRGVWASHVARKALRGVWQGGRPRTDVVRSALAEAAFLEIAGRTFGPQSMIRGRQGFFPHIFAPDYHGPHFDEAMRRIVFHGRGPSIVYFSITGSCPCECDYCFAGAGGAGAPDLGDEPILEVAREIAALRVPLVNLSGGEPLSRYRRTVDATRILSAGSEVRMFTTGIGLTRCRLGELRDAGLRGVFVSLDTPDRQAYDRVRRRPGAFDAAVAALKLCAKADMLTFINAVVGPGDLPDAASVVRFLRFVEGIDSRIVVNFLPRLATGRGADANGFSSPDASDALADRIVSTARSIGRPVTMLFGTVDHFIGCPGAGGKLMNIDIQGNVTVCISRAGLGNLLEEPFPVIYRRFTEACSRLKVGFFCCEVSRQGDGELLAPEDSRRAIDRFFRETDDAQWQQIMDRVVWLFASLIPT